MTTLLHKSSTSNTDYFIQGQELLDPDSLHLISHEEEIARLPVETNLLVKNLPKNHWNVLITDSQIQSNNIKTFIKR